MANETELERSGDASEYGRVGNGVDDNVRVVDDSHFQLRESDLIMPGVLMTCILGLVVVLILLGIGGCASVPPTPSAGPQQKTAAVVANPNCVVACSVQVSQSTALEDIKNNAAPVTAGAQSQSTSQTSTQTISPTTTTSTVKDIKP
jgi:hypothetical protein